MIFFYPEDQKTWDYWKLHAMIVISKILKYLLLNNLYESFETIVIFSTLINGYN